ncbi:MAG: phosphotransferase [Pseudonocardiales bacterium]|nr:phosphotransferase [Pseudonocardiales bacterium]
MLSCADEALAARDPLLPDLRLLLDADACRSLIADRLGWPVQLTPRYLRYKPGTSCVLAADVLTSAGEQSWLITSYAAESAQKVAKAVECAPEGSVLIADPDRGLLIATAAADRDLPGLAALHDRRRQRLLRRLLGQHDLVVDGPQLRTIRHNPHRRWVGTLRATNGPQALLRAYRPEHMRASTDAIAALARSELGTPRLLGRHKRLGVAALEFLPGVTLAELGHPDDRGRDCAGYRSAGVALARLHACTGLALAPIAATAEVTSVLKSSRQLARLIPGTAAEVKGLTDSVAARLRALPSLQRPLHGDFSADQVVIGDGGQGALIDLDSARLGDPASDLACAAAALFRDVVLGGCSPERYDRRLRALFDGYLSAGADIDMDRLATHEAAHLLRRAVEPFRLRRTPEWAVAARLLIKRTGEVLRAGSLSGALR